MIKSNEQIPEDQWQVHIGEKYNFLTVISSPFWVQTKSGGKRQRAIFRCDCGKEKECLCRRVKIGYTKSCGIRCILTHSVIKDGLKRCSTCGVRKTLDAFSRNRTMSDGYTPKCKNCVDLAKINSQYGITIGEYNKMLELQGGVCAICHGEAVRQRKRLDIDHDHKTDDIRGLLCSNCNRAIGLLKDDPQILENAFHYLQYHKGLIPQENCTSGIWFKL